MIKEPKPPQRPRTSMHSDGLGRSRTAARLATTWVCAAMLIALIGVLSVRAFARTRHQESVVRNELSKVGVYTTDDAWPRLKSTGSQDWLFITDDDGGWLQQSHGRRRRGQTWRRSRASPRRISRKTIRYGRNYPRVLNPSCFAGPPRSPPDTSGDSHSSPQPARRFSAERWAPRSNPVFDESTGTAPSRCVWRIPRQIVATSGVIQAHWTALRPESSEFARPKSELASKQGTQARRPHSTRSLGTAGVRELRRSYSKPSDSTLQVKLTKRGGMSNESMESQGFVVGPWVDFCLQRMRDVAFQHSRAQFTPSCERRTRHPGPHT